MTQILKRIKKDIESENYEKLNIEQVKILIGIAQAEQLKRIADALTTAVPDEDRNITDALYSIYSVL